MVCLRLHDAKKKNRFPSPAGQILTLPIDWKKKRKKWKTMNFFILSHTRYRVKQAFQALHLVLLISFCENWTRARLALFSLLKKTRKTVFQSFSKLKLLEVIRHYRITYSHPSNKRKPPWKEDIHLMPFTPAELSFMPAFGF